MGADTHSLDETGKKEAPYVNRTVALVGLMGAGKSTVGKRLADALGRDFFDSDHEIEKAAGLPVADIFSLHGEAEFRRGERRVLERLLMGPPHVLATGGGAYLDPNTRVLMRERAITVWLNADLETLWRRVQKRDSRPLLRVPDPKAALQQLLDERRPVYAEADLCVTSADGPHKETVRSILQALEAWTIE